MRRNFEKNRFLEFDFDGNSYSYGKIESISFNNCDKMDYVSDNAFTALNNLKQVSFDGSSLFFLSGEAFYNCRNLEIISLKNTNLKYIDSSLGVIYTGQWHKHSII